jgi:hypothetical protein
MSRSTTPAGLTVVGKLRLLGRVWATAARVQLDLWRRPLPEVAAPAPPTPARVGARTSPTLLSRAVWRGLRIGPVRPRCLQRSLVLYRLLREQGDDAELIIGLERGATSSDAHAWVELHGRDIGPPPGGSGFEELARFPRVRTPTVPPS